MNRNKIMSILGAVSFMLGEYALASRENPWELFKDSAESKQALNAALMNDPELSRTMNGIKQGSLASLNATLKSMKNSLKQKDLTAALAKNENGFCDSLWNCLLERDSEHKVLNSILAELCEHQLAMNDTFAIHLQRVVLKNEKLNGELEIFSESIDPLTELALELQVTTDAGIEKQFKDVMQDANDLMADVLKKLAEPDCKKAVVLALREDQDMKRALIDSLTKQKEGRAILNEKIFNQLSGMPLIMGKDLLSKTQKVFEQSGISIDFMMIIGKYFESNKDYVNVMKVGKKYNQLVLMYKFNPISDISLFKNIQTQHFYKPEDLQMKKDGLFQYIYWYEVEADFQAKDNDILKNCILKRARELKETENALSVPKGVTSVSFDAIRYSDFNPVIKKISGQKTLVFPFTVKHIIDPAGLSYKVLHKQDIKAPIHLWQDLEEFVKAQGIYGTITLVDDKDQVVKKLISTQHGREVHISEETSSAN